MKYLVKTLETELWNRWYEVEADSKDEARKVLRTWNYPQVKEHSEDYIETTDIEYLEVEPYED